MIADRRRAVFAVMENRTVMKTKLAFLPAVSRDRGYFGKKVIQMGFKDSKLRDQCNAHIAWKQAGKNLGFNARKQAEGQQSGQGAGKVCE